jgi:site-specific recombinase XerD
MYCILQYKISRRHDHRTRSHDAKIDRALRAGVLEDVSPHSFRGAGITLYLESGGSLEHAQAIADHASPRTTKLYDRTGDQLSLDEIERIPSL